MSDDQPDEETKWVAERHDEETKRLQEESKDPVQWVNEDPPERASVTDDGELDVASRDDIPETPTHETVGKAPMAVTTEALRTFSANVRQLSPPLERSREDLIGASVPAGAFEHAHQLTRKVLGAGSGAGAEDNSSVVPGTTKTLTDAINVLATVADLMEQSAVLYERAESENDLDATKLKEYLDTASSHVTTATGMGPGSAPTGTGPDSAATGAGTGSGSAAADGTSTSSDGSDPGSTSA